MRFSVLAAAPVLLLLAACGPTAAEASRLDLGHGVVAAFGQGPSSEAQGKVAYVTHVSSGSQMVIGREGQVISRHNGRGDGPAQLDVILADQVIMGDIIAGANAEDPLIPERILRIHFVKFEGITYLAKEVRPGIYSAKREGLAIERDLSAERYRVAFKLDDYARPGYHSQNGDAAYLDLGTPIFELKRYAPEFRLAAVVDGAVTLFEADRNPAARTGADLLDIRGKVRSIGINSPGGDERTELASIDSRELVDRLVEIVLSSPVDRSRRDRAGEIYVIVFHLEDGTAVRSLYWLESGEMLNGMMTPPSFRVSVLQALAQATAPTPTPTPAPRTTTTICSKPEEIPRCPGVEMWN